MKASQLILFAVVGVAALWAVKKFGLLSMAPTPSTVTKATTTGKQSVVGKSEFQTVADDITSIFSSATSLFGNSAQTESKSL